MMMTLEEGCYGLKPLDKHAATHEVGTYGKSSEKAKHVQYPVLNTVTELSLNPPPNFTRFHGLYLYYLALNFGVSTILIPY